MSNNIYARRREIERELNEIEARRKELKKQKSILIEECNHEIIVNSFKVESDNNLVSFVPTTMTCLLCGKVVSPKRNHKIDLSKSEIIDLNEYPQFVKQYEDSISNIIENMYKLKKLVNCEDSEQEIGKDIKDHLQQMEADYS